VQIGSTRDVQLSLSRSQGSILPLVPRYRLEPGKTLLYQPLRMLSVER
jgi:hypothetical protein